MGDIMNVRKWWKATGSCYFSNWKAAFVRIGDEFRTHVRVQKGGLSYSWRMNQRSLLDSVKQRADRIAAMIEETHLRIEASKRLMENCDQVTYVTLNESRRPRTIAQRGKSI